MRACVVIQKSTDALCLATSPSVRSGWKIGPLGRRNRANEIACKTVPSTTQIRQIDGTLVGISVLASLTLGPRMLKY